MTDSATICICMRLGESNAYNHVRPIADSAAVRTVHLVRPPASAWPDHPKIVYHTVPERPTAARYAAMYRVVRRLFCSGELDLVCSFNPLPYALIAVAAVRGALPYHLGFIGSDWGGRIRSKLWPALAGVIRRSSLVTVTGPAMRRELLKSGPAPDRVVVLPHGIDRTRFCPGDPAEIARDFIFVGSLIRRKRVDLILRAFAIVRAHRPGATLTVVGDGPLRAPLERLAARLGIAEGALFVGHSDHVEEHLRRARCFVLASRLEGFPFATVEAMSCGLVPVCTAVGTIPDTLADGETGFLVPPGDVRQFGKRMIALLSDKEMYARMRQACLARAGDLSFENVTRLWDGWLPGMLSRGAGTQPPPTA